MLVIDNYIKDNTFLKDLKNDEFWNTMANANWWDGWWNKKSKNICEQFIEIVWKQFTNVENKVAGFEYWSNVHQTGGGLNWHVDKDERLSKEKIEVVCIIDKEMQKGDLSKADVSINFCVPSAAVENIFKSFDYKVPVVCGTTGWLDNFDLVKKYCEEKETAFIYSSNFSFGVNIFFKITTKKGKKQ